MNNPLPHKLQVRNSARKLAAAIDVLRTTPQEIALLTQHFPKARISSLADYQGMLKPAVDQIDAGREPHVVMRMELEMDGRRFPLSAGMQANAEILLGTRTVMEYLLSPVRKAWHEAGRER